MPTNASRRSSATRGRGGCYGNRDVDTKENMALKDQRVSSANSLTIGKNGYLKYILLKYLTCSTYFYIYRG